MTNTPDDDETSALPTVELPDPIQRALDEAVSGMTMCAVFAGDAAIRPVTDWLEHEQNHLTDLICTTDCWLHVVNPHWLANVAWEFEPGEQSNLERATFVRGLLARVLGGDQDLWGLEYPVRIRVPVTTSAGEPQILGCRFSRFDDSPPVEWEGLFSNDDSYRRWLRSEGYLASLSDFDALPLGTRAAFVSPATPALPARPFCCYITQDNRGAAHVQIPKRRPRSAKFIGHVEWAWGPAHSRSDYLYLSLSSDKKHWLLWHEWHDEYGDQSRAGAYTSCSQASPEETAAALVECYYQGEQKEFAEIEGPWDVAAAGVLSIVELTRIAAALWPPTLDASPDARLARPRGSQCRYFAVEEIPPLGESAWSFESELLEEAFDAYTNQVAANVASGHGTGLVFVFDRTRRRVVSSTDGGSADGAVEYWLT